ncbi:hypothetical protein QQS21_010283 [Conoideocrella luteorostrata]|uniref:Extracellular membrane protein CFEM domain-containing protein n=1 Tax=Conoideocrella luteorostrata TaxID=1105319 RepID=A0AAJ0CHY9_9HYPO|nr:hypothetical protein QQS21_010283 [Conoideocrella luteorostrata]
MARKRTQFLSLFFLLPSVCAALESDFSFYPPKAQTCLNDASKSSKCTGDDAKALNSCLCSNGGNFITNAAQCLGRSDKADVKAVYTTMADACATSGTPMTISQQEFFDAADGVVKTTTTSASSTATSMSTSTTTTTTTTASGTATASPTGASDHGNKSEGLPKGAVIGIAAGSSIAGLIALMGLVMFCIRRRRGKTEVESHPMLGQSEYYNHNTPTTFPPNEPSPDYSQFGSDQKASWGKSPSPGLQSQRTSVQYAGPYASPPLHDDMAIMPGHQPAMHGAMGQTYELDASSAPARTHLAAEMEGSQPPRHSGIYQ